MKESLSNPITWGRGERRPATLSRFTAMAMSAVVFAICACKPKTQTDAERVWIIPTFTTPDGHAIQMGFNNPANPDMTLSECQAALHDQIPRVVAEARAQEPQRLAQAKLTAIRCVSAVGDPLAPKPAASGKDGEGS